MYRQLTLIQKAICALWNPRKSRTRLWITVGWKVNACHHSPDGCADMKTLKVVRDNKVLLSLPSPKKKMQLRPSKEGHFSFKVNYAAPRRTLTSLQSDRARTVGLLITRRSTAKIRQNVENAEVTTILLTTSAKPAERLTPATTNHQSAPTAATTTTPQIETAYGG